MNDVARMPVELRYFAGLSGEDAAQILGHLR